MADSGGVRGVQMHPPFIVSEPDPRKIEKEGLAHQPSLVPRPLSEKSRRGLVTQPYSAMFTYAVKIGGVRGCMACMIE